MSLFLRCRIWGLSHCPGEAFKSHRGEIYFVFEEDYPTGVDGNVHKFYRGAQLFAGVELLGQFFHWGFRRGGSHWGTETGVCLTSLKRPNSGFYFRCVRNDFTYFLLPEVSKLGVLKVLKTANCKIFRGCAPTHLGGGAYSAPQTPPSCYPRPLALPRCSLRSLFKCWRKSNSFLPYIRRKTWIPYSFPLPFL